MCRCGVPDWGAEVWTPLAQNLHPATWSLSLALRAGACAAAALTATALATAGRLQVAAPAAGSQCHAADLRRLLHLRRHGCSCGCGLGDPDAVVAVGLEEDFYSYFAAAVADQSGRHGHGQLCACACRRPQARAGHCHGPLASCCHHGDLLPSPFACEAEPLP